jgi:hypothetical protein
VPDLLRVIVRELDCRIEHLEISMKLTFSWVLSACHALIRENRQENTHGGALISRVGT